MKWLITGGCGFLGTNLIRRLVEDKSNCIRIVDNLMTGTRDDLASISDFNEVNADSINSNFDNGAVELVVGNILDDSLALKVTSGMDIIVHLAANTGVGPSVENPRIDCEVNVMGTFNYLEAARINQVKRFIMASSGAPVGEVEPPIHERLAPRPASPYGASKLAGEGYCSAYSQCYGVNTVALRFGNVYGPGSEKKMSVVAKFIRRALDGKPLEIYGDGSQTRDFIYIADLIEAILMSAVKDGTSGEIFQIASSKETTISEIAEAIVSILEEQGIARINVINEQVRQGDVKYNYSDTSKAKNILGWESRTPLREGLEQTIRYFLN